MADETRLADLNNKDLVLHALYEAGGAVRHVSTEHVAGKVFEYPLGRQRYRWEHFEQYPDKERVARELRRMKNAAGIILVEGHVNVGSRKDRRDGWRLTPAGIERVKRLQETFDQHIRGGTGEAFVYNVENLRRRLIGSACYRAYSVDPELRNVSDIEFTDLLYLLPDSPDAKIRTTFEQLMGEAKAGSADDLVQFLSAVGRRFANFLATQEGSK